MEIHINYHMLEINVDRDPLELSVGPYTSTHRNVITCGITSSPHEPTVGALH